MEFSICIDVDDVDRAVEFYGRGLGLTVVEQHPDWAQVKLGDQTCWIMKAPAGVQGQISRDYRNDTGRRSILISRSKISRPRSNALSMRAASSTVKSSAVRKVRWPICRTRQAMEWIWSVP